MEIGEKITMRKSEKTNHPKNIDNLDLILLSCLILSIVSSYSMYYSPQAYDVAAQQQEKATSPIATSQTTPNLVLPKSLLVTDSKMGEAQLPLRASIMNEKSDGELTDLKEDQGEGKL
jgi:hypothetical protein